ncbi:ABC transporter ATP-binding protein [Thermoleptolyngbya sp. C42_A2020_037]|uniref:ABC transporter ATP-binding protein n=1 Tax=Thermoleptolyngbya sp. C42_A2020_037 TaxID=2747799 RepID=UPI0019F0975E|nr:ABC transporter ATP-binding protein/permease [Thermoleptolyngbya sp. C42_A2020_037]MBF2083439.1 ABC transporter ATP-binding protein/permease [Thermoleptolyngbya sp. C42_A2020_037]
MPPSRFLFYIARQYPGWIGLTVLLGLLGGVFNGVSTALIAPVLLNFLGQPVPLRGLPEAIQRLLSPFENLPEGQRLWVMTVAVVLLIGLKNLAAYGNALVAGALKRVLVTDWREAGLRLLLSVDLSFFAGSSLGDVMNQLNVEVNRSATAVATAVRGLTTGITILVFLGLLLALSWPLTLVAAGLLAGVTLVNQMSVARSRQYGEALSEASKHYSIALLDVLTGMRLVRASATEDQEYARLRRRVRDRERAEYQSLASSAAIAPLSEVVGVVALILIVWIGRTFLATEMQTLSTVLLTFLLLLFRMLPLLGQLNTARNQFANALPSIQQTQTFLDRRDKPFMQNGTIPFTGLRQGIRFRDVSFSYAASDRISIAQPERNSIAEPDRFVLEHISLELPKGTTLALVGASGAGKSTLADLLPRFYDPTLGTVELDGIDLRQFDLKTVRRAMGIISQDTILFNASVRDNIAYGCPDATEAQVWQAAKLAYADEFIRQLPDGLDTRIGDRGVLLSGGQRQRLAIARALLKNPEILILDEATSALDTVSERLVQAAIEALSRDRTTLVIAHRLSTVQRADQIAVLDQGRVVELGTHEDLLRQNGYYARLCALQFADEMAPSASAVPTQLARRSYEIRNRLNAMIGSLRLLVDGIVTDPDEQIELTEEAYYSTLNVLRSLEALERGYEGKSD